MDMRDSIWNMTSLYWASSLVSVSKELSKYMSDLVAVQVRWKDGGTEPEGQCTCFYRKGNGIHELSTGFLVVKRIISAVKRVNSVSDRMSNIILRGCWRDTVPELHAPTEDKLMM
jgi:hypothetical protein